MNASLRVNGKPLTPDLAGPAVDLREWDLILVQSSAGKDSQAMLHVIATRAAEQGVADRVVVIHCDLGRVEWRGTRELAAEQARHYGARFETISRPQGDLLQHVEARGQWPSSTARYCTSDHKRGQAAKVCTALVSEWRAANGGRRCRVLNCLGFRAEESSARAKREPWTENTRLSNGRRHVQDWLPIHHWSTAEVWDTIDASGVRSHDAYRLGMPRLSCVFCIFAPKAALVIAGRENRQLLEEYVALEERIGHRFRTDLSMAEVREAVLNTDDDDTQATAAELAGAAWCM